MDNKEFREMLDRVRDKNKFDPISGILDISTLDIHKIDQSQIAYLKRVYSGIHEFVDMTLECLEYPERTPKFQRMYTNMLGAEYIYEMAYAIEAAVNAMIIAITMTHVEARSWADKYPEYMSAYKTGFESTESSAEFAKRVMQDMTDLFERNPKSEKKD
jgi:hypothetical protein